MVCQLEDCVDVLSSGIFFTLGSKYLKKEKEKRGERKGKRVRKKREEREEREEKEKIVPV
jgi:hypothetical protein